MKVNLHRQVLRCTKRIVIKKGTNGEGFHVLRERRVIDISSKAAGEDGEKGEEQGSFLFLSLSGVL